MSNFDISLIDYLSVSDFPLLIMRLFRESLLATAGLLLNVIGLFIWLIILFDAAAQTSRYRWAAFIVSTLALIFLVTVFISAANQEAARYLQEKASVKCVRVHLKHPDVLWHGLYQIGATEKYILFWVTKHCDAESSTRLPHQGSLAIPRRTISYLDLY